MKYFFTVWLGALAFCLASLAPLFAQVEPLVSPLVRPLVAQLDISTDSKLLNLSGLNSPLYQETSSTTPASSNNDPVGEWIDGSGSREFEQSTAGARPLLKTAIPSLLFDGSDDYLRYAGSLTDVVGSLILAFRTGGTAFSADQVFFSSADEGSANNWFEIGVSGEGKVYVSSNVGGTIHRVVGSSVLAVSTSYIVALTHDGTDFFMQVGATEQNPLVIESSGAYAWFGDVSGADNLLLGGTLTSAGLQRPFAGEIMQIDIYAEDLTE